MLDQRVQPDLTTTVNFAIAWAVYQKLSAAKHSTQKYRF